MRTNTTHSWLENEDAVAKQLEKETTGIGNWVGILLPGGMTLETKLSTGIFISKRQCIHLHFSFHAGKHEHHVARCPKFFQSSKHNDTVNPAELIPLAYEDVAHDCVSNSPAFTRLWPDLESKPMSDITLDMQ